MSAIQYACRRVKFSIPTEVLWRGLTIDIAKDQYISDNIEDLITVRVIKDRVLEDSDVKGGPITVIPLGGIRPKVQEQRFTVYEIPAELIQNRTMMSVLMLTQLNHHHLTGYHPGTGTHAAIPQYGATANVATRIGNAAADSSPITNTRVSLVGHNLVLVHENYRLLGHAGLKCVLANDGELQNLQPRGYDAFGHLCTLATKSFIYNNLIIKTNLGFLEGGQELGQMNSIVSSYESAEEEYLTYLREIWTKVLYMNNTKDYSTFIQSMIPSGI